ncbi:MAG: hypothetical protein NC417_11540 [Candidatus Gastranaerophilales bacterium]|nr:hypothetical protein [Candidatus Gastranaerophilales bacterium]
MKKNQVKKGMTAIMLAAAAVLTFAVPAMAEEYDADGTADCSVTARVVSTYTVSIPAAVSLDYDKESGTVSGSYRIGVKGELLPGQMVQVVPVQLKETLAAGTGGEYYQGVLTGEKSKRALPVTVTQQVTRWIPTGTEPSWGEERFIRISASDFVYVDGTIVSDKLEEADTYSGTLVFEFGLEEYEWWQ